MQLTHATLPFSSKPIVDSYDSGDECSLYHWLEVCKLVEDAEIISIETEIDYSRLEEILEETELEVEPATAN